MPCCNFIVTLLVASIGILEIKAWDDGERRVRPNKAQIPVDEAGTVLEALTVQKNNIYNTGPNDRNIYGSIARQETEIYESPDSSRPSSTQTRTAIAPGGPGRQGISYARSEERPYQGQQDQNQKPGDGDRNVVDSLTYQEGNTYNTGPNDRSSYGSVTVRKNQVYQSEGGNNQAQLSEDQIPTNQDNIQRGSITVQTGNTYNTDPDSKNSFGSITHQEGNQYNFDPNPQGPKNTQNGTKSQEHSAKHKAPNKQSSLSSDNFSLLLFSCIVLLKYCLF